MTVVRRRAQTHCSSCVCFKPQVPDKCRHCGAGLGSSKQSLYPWLAEALVRLYELPYDFYWTRDPAWGLGLVQYTNVSKLRYWGFIEMEKRGWWRITERGIAFVEGDLVVPEFFMTMRRKVIEVSIDMVRITDRLPSFNYDEFMAGRYIYTELDALEAATTR